MRCYGASTSLRSSTSQAVCASHFPSVSKPRIKKSHWQSDQVEQTPYAQLLECKKKSAMTWCCIWWVSAAKFNYYSLFLSICHFDISRHTSKQCKETSQNSETRALIRTQVGWLTIERYSKRHLAAQVHSPNGLRDMFKFLDILGCTLYSQHISWRFFEPPLTQYFSFINYMYRVVLWFVVLYCLKDLLSAPPLPRGWVGGHTNILLSSMVLFTAINCVL